MAADGEALDRADPELLAAIGLRRHVGERNAAVDLIDQPKVAKEVPEIADLPLVEMREVDARAEQALAGVARVIDHAAAQHADVATLIEQRDVDRRLERHERRFVLGVEEARVLHRHDRRLALALDAGAAEVERARALELRKPR